MLFVFEFRNQFHRDEPFLVLSFRNALPLVRLSNEHWDLIEMVKISAVTMMNPPLPFPWRHKYFTGREAKTISQTAKLTSTFIFSSENVLQTSENYGKTRSRTMCSGTWRNGSEAAAHRSSDHLPPRPTARIARESAIYTHLNLSTIGICQEFVQDKELITISHWYISVVWDHRGNNHLLFVNQLKEPSKFSPYSKESLCRFWSQIPEFIFALTMSHISFCLRLCK